MNINLIQKRIFKNKQNKGFNTEKIEPELLFLTEEIGEAVAAHRRDKREELVSEVVDIAIYALGLLAILGVDAEKEITKKMEINEVRKYVGSKKGWGHTRID